MKEEEILKYVVEAVSQSPYPTPNGWFFPGDVYPHSQSLKYKCNKLYKLGLLERRGDSSDRWGYSYRILVEKEG